MTTTNTHTAEKPFSSHPDDKHLTVVLHQNFKGEWVTHIHNSCDNGYCHGHYHGDDYAGALKDFQNRGAR
jgi:hypothetical protein